jgi:hypothetical protein
MADTECAKISAMQADIEDAMSEKGGEMRKKCERNLKSDLSCGLGPPASFET